MVALTVRDLGFLHLHPNWRGWIECNLECGSNPLRRGQRARNNFSAIGACKIAANGDCPRLGYIHGW